MSIRIRVIRQLSIATLTGSAMAASLLCGTAPLAATLPVPCAAGSCAPNKTPGFGQPGGFVTAGQASATQSGNTLTINQSSAQAILNWASFNIGADGKVVFQQPGATSVALNKIYQASPSSIFGQLAANGQVYLINPNGFVFGSTSSVNVAGLIAASMGFTKGDSAITNGFLPQSGQLATGSALTTDGRLYVTDASGNVVLDAQGNPQPVQIVVQPGAQMNATNGGRLMLAGQQVVNSGSLTAADGQVVLGAGQSIYLAASADPNLRGLIVEVSNNPDPSVTPAGGAPAPDDPAPDDPAAKQLGTVSNQAGALLSSARGNVSLVGLAVNQSGRISATTAVAANGSVILRAADGGASGIGGVGSCQNNAVLCANAGGTLKIGSTSEIDVLPDLTDTTTAVVGQTQNQSQIALTGQQIDIEGGKITAPAGNLSVVAAANPDLGLAQHGNPAAQLRVASGTHIDLSGSTAVLPMSANLLTLQLRSNELADDPVQRIGALQAQTVIVDTRDGRPPLVSETSWLSALQGIPENILQRTAVGGKASFLSEGDVVVGNGATINVSGGKWTYQSGVTQTSQLLGANGKLYDIGTADPSLSYTSVINPTFTQSFNGFGVQITQATPGLGHSETGYSQGMSAGQVNFAAPAMSLQGSLVGTAVNGPYQRSAANIPAESLFGYMAANKIIPGNGIAGGGTLIIGDPNPTFTGDVPDYFSPAVTFTNNPSPVIIAAGAPLTSQTLELPVSYINSGGFQQTRIYGDSTVSLPTGLPLNLGPGGSLAVQAAHISIGSSILAPAGTLDLESGDTFFTAATGLPRTGIDIASGVTLDVRGQWTNNSVYAAGGSVVAPAYQDGGEIKLSLTNPNAINTVGGKLTIGDDVNLEASGGAWIQPNNTIVGGKGGTIILDASPYQSGIELDNNVSLDAFGVQGALGGTFSLSAPRIAVTQGSNGTWAGAQSVDDLTKPDSTPPGGGDPGAAQPGGTNPADTKSPVAFIVGAGLFSQDGFSAVNLAATAPVAETATSNDILTVKAGTTINAQAQSWQLASGYATRASGGDVTAFTHAATLPTISQNPFSLTLQTVAGRTDPQSAAVFGDLDIQAGASINLVANSKAKVSLVSEGSLLVNGTLRAPGGAITATINAPEAFNDPGYLADQRLELRPEATLDVSGTTLYTPNVQNLALGTVLSGGNINLSASRGDIIAEAGSALDFSGASAVLDVRTIGGSGGYRTATVGSAGGSLLVQSVESISLLGSLAGAAGASSVGTLAGGRLEVDLVPQLFKLGPNAAALTNPLPGGVPTIELVANAAGSIPTASYGNLAVLGVAQLEQSGIDNLTLKSDSTIELASNTALSLEEQINLDAPNISVSYGTSAALIAPYVALTNSNTSPASPAALGGTGALNVTAQQIALSGAIALQGVANVTFASSGDVELQPEPAYGANNPASSLSLAGNLTINAARVYPATQTSFTINDSTGNVTIGQTTASPGTPLSVAGSLTIHAANITSSGTILAPFGSITLDASNSLSLLSRSLTSVSADGAVLPYGQTILGQSQWVYDGTIPINGVPGRQISLTAPNVSFASGATIDLSGGGNLTAYEWVPGTGGYVDALGPVNAAANNLYAILPSMRGQYAAYDFQEFSGSNVAPGASVYLSGVPGLPAGYYPLLPARYALMPGAYLVQAEPGFTSLTSGQIGALADGTPVVAGYTSFGTTGLQSSTGYSGFAVRPGSYVQALAQYHVTDAATYFAAAAASAGKTDVTLPADAGTLLIAASSTLSALGKVTSSAASGGAAATVEIASTDITVTPSAAQTAATGVSISAPILQSWDVGNLILGGGFSADGSVTVTADTVTFAQGAQFTAGQVIAVADKSIEVQSGAVVASTSGQSGTAPKALPQAAALNLVHQDPTQTTPQLVADNTAALLAVSDVSLPVVARPSGSTTTGSSAATVQIDSGATLSSRGAIALDAPGAVNIDGTLNAPGANWSLASSDIAFVGAKGSSSDSLVINPGLLAQMQSAGGLWLFSAGNIDLLTPVTLGVSGSGASPTLGSLSLTAAAINNLSGGAAVLGAQTVTLQGNDAEAPTATNSIGTDGTLTLVANNLHIGFAPGTNGVNALPGYTGNLAINGNSQTTLQVSQALTGQGYSPAVSSNTSGQPAASATSSNTIGIAGDVTIAAAELTAASHSDTSLSLPDGVLTIQQQGTAADPATLGEYSLGGKLSLTASQIQDSGSIIVPGGRIALQTTLASDPAAPVSRITLDSGAVIDAGGISVSAGNQTVGAAGGIVDISTSGDLSLAAGARINVSGAGQSPAGFLSLTGGGTVTLAGSLAGNAAATATGGSFWLDAGQLQGGLENLTGQLTAGGFTNQVNVRVRTGDLDSGAGTILTANQITLSADTGGIDIAGTLNAPEAGTRGSIGLFAGNGLTLESAGRLLANGSGSSGRGGDIELSTLGGSITLDNGSVIAATGQAQDGSLLLRAPALVSTGDVAIGGIGSNFSVGQVTIEPVLPTYSSTADFTQDFSQIQSDVTSYLAQANTVLAGRFGDNIVIEPGVVINAPGDLTLSQALDLYALQLGAPIDLTVRSSGSITLDGMISDGLVNGNTVPAAQVPVQGEPLPPPYVTSTLRFVAGADLASANPLATVAGNSADLTLNSGGIVTTGTGDIDLVAAHDVSINPGAGAYTTGAAGSPAVNVRLGGSQVPVNFLTNGGNVVVNAGRDVIGADGLSPSGVTSWQAHNVKGNLGYWGVNLDGYNQNPWTFATFGGGDLSVTAGRDVANVAAATADSLALTGTTAQVHFASGGMTVDAGRDITSGQFFIANGTGTLNAGRSFGANLSLAGKPVGSVFEVETSQVALWAEDNIAVEGVINPTLQSQPLASGSLANLTFFTYDGDSAFSAQSSSGDVALSGDVGAIGVLAGAAQGQDSFGWKVLPANLRLVSLTQSLDGPTGTLFPSATGQLQLFAGKDIAGGSIFMSDAPDSDIQTAANYSANVNGVGNITSSDALPQDEFNADLHANDPTPASIVAGRDITNVWYAIPKQTQISAGRDIVNLQFSGQNLNPNDLTLISAGRDFTAPPSVGNTGLVATSVASYVAVGGPGQLDILAGRNIDLGFSEGVTTNGNVKNPNIPTAVGASITMAAGLGQDPDYPGFLAKIIEPSSTYQQMLVSYVESLNGQSNLSAGQADAQFGAFTPDQQRACIDTVFFAELNESGLEANSKPGAGYTRGYAAIDALFPKSRSGNDPYSGDLSLKYSQVYTLSGGGIFLLVPGGELNVGLAAAPNGSSTIKDPSQLGIVAQGAGNVSIYSMGDVNVNSSRVFTLGGGDILIWSDVGNIDAGNGAKTSLSLPPPSYKPDKFGNPQLVFNAAVAGSGIRTIQTGPSVAAGNVNLIAPVGAVNAGDAGIGAAGNVNLAAAVVTGASNINFGGSATGVPPAVANVTASVSGAASAASATANTASSVENLANRQDETASATQAAIGWLDVFVTGLGDENCKPEDQECLERQKHP